MKHYLLIIALLIGSLSGLAANYEQWVYLNNGNVLYGIVETRGTSIKITTDTGEEYTYPLAEVRTISDNKLNSPSITRDPDLKSYENTDKGFWIAGQVQGAYSLMLHGNNIPMIELDVTGGYRFNEYLRAGLGLGVRYYINNKKMRKSSVALSMPVYANVRGNIIHGGYRTVVPYYSLDIGGAVRDGFLWRPTIGIRVGQERSAFLAGLTYTGQCYKSANTNNTRYGSFLGITLGYEY